MKRYLSIRGLNICILFLLPYLTIIILFSPSFFLEVRKPQLQQLLIWETRINSLQTNEKEAIKAEMIINRTNLYRYQMDGERLASIAKSILKSARKKNIYYIKYNTYKYLEDIEEETNYKILTWKEEAAEIPYCYCTSGETRNGMEVFGDKKYSYLKQVNSEQDKECPLFLSEILLNKQQFPIDIKVLERDSAGYVLKIKVGDSVISGEEFADKIDVKSTNFTLQEQKDAIRIIVKGSGHGIGYSQFGGNEMAQEGASCEEILEHYFPLMVIKQKKLSSIE